MTHICVSKLTIIASDNGLSPSQRQAIIRTSAGILLIGPLGTNFSEIWIEILTFSFKKMRLKVSSAKWRPFCLGFNVLITLVKITKSVWEGCSFGRQSMMLLKDIRYNLFRWWLFISYMEPSLNFNWSYTTWLLFPSVKMRWHENLFGSFAKLRETLPRRK